MNSLLKRLKVKYYVIVLKSQFLTCFLKGYYLIKFILKKKMYTSKLLKYDNFNERILMTAGFKK